MVKDFSGYDLDASPQIREKILKKHGVEFVEVEEAFCNSTREDWVRPRDPRHDPPATYQFTAPTMSDRWLVAWVTIRRAERTLWLKTAMPLSKWLDLGEADFDDDER